MAQRVLAMALIAIALTASARADVSATPDRRTAGVKETFYIVVRAEGSRIGEPVLPHAEGLVIQRRPASTRQQTSVNFINGRVQQSNVREWHFEAWATQEGNIEVPPVKVQVDGEDQLSRPFTMQISNSPQAQPGAQPQSAPAPNRMPGRQSPPQQSTRDAVTVDDLILLKAELSKQEVYEGEAVGLTITFASLDDPGVFVRGDQGNSIVIPSVEGFYESEIVSEKKSDSINGIPYSVTTFTRPMFATRAGTIELPSVLWTGRVTAPSNLGPRSYRVERSTDPLTITVKPLPDRPANFSGAVGRFNLSANLEPGPVEQGRPKTFKVTIAGSGNVDAIAKPTLPELEWAHLSEPEVSVEELAGPLEFQKEFTYTLTPVEAAQHQIPSIEFCFFSPELGNYKTVSTKPLDVNVILAKDEGQLVAVGGSAPATSGSIEVLNSDIAGIRTQSLGLEPPASSLPLNSLGFGAPPLVFLACLAYVRRQRRMATDTGFARGVRARTRSQRRLQAAASSKDPGEALFKALTGFVGDKLNLPDAGLTSQDVRSVMEKHGFSPALTEEYVAVLRTCERHRYSGEPMGADAVRALTDAAYAALEHLERETRGGGR